MSVTRYDCVTEEASTYSMDDRLAVEVENAGGGIAGHLHDGAERNGGAVVATNESLETALGTELGHDAEMALLCAHANELDHRGMVAWMHHVKVPRKVSKSNTTTRAVADGVTVPTMCIVSASRRNS
jgi:hypothetical protein